MSFLRKSIRGKTFISEVVDPFIDSTISILYIEFSIDLDFRYHGNQITASYSCLICSTTKRSPFLYIYIYIHKIKIIVPSNKIRNWKESRVSDQSIFNTLQTLVSTNATEAGMFSKRASCLSPRLAGPPAVHCPQKPK